MRTAKGRERLSLLLRHHPQLISVEDAASVFVLPRGDASKLLSRWTTQGWLKRVRSGLYAPIPLAAESSEQVLTDPWILVPRLFDPAYLGGWTAAEHWDFTEQIFRSLCVFTDRRVRNADLIVQSIPFHLKRSPKHTWFGLTVVWRENTRVQVSDRTKTIVDMLDDPAIGGGVQHVASCLESYLRSEHFDRDRLVDYIERQRNGAIFKRLGYLMERLVPEDSLFDELSKRSLTKGNAKLDPALPAEKLVTRWRLWVPLSWTVIK